MKFYKFIVRKHHEKDIEDLIKEEMKKLEAEIETIQQQSTEEINEVLSD